MNIAVIQRFLPSVSRGGVGYFTHGLCNALVHRGHSVTVFSQDSAPEDALYQVHCVPKSSCVWKDPLLFPFQVRRLDLSGFDIVHAQGDDQWIGPRSSLRVVRTLHGSAWKEAIYNGLACHSLKRFLMHSYFYLMELIAVLRADTVIAVSEDTRHYYPKFDGVIPNGVDAKAYTSVGTGKSTHPSILFVGEMNSRKRGALLLNVFREKIFSEIPGAELWLVSPEKVEEKNVVWFGKVDSLKLIELYQQAWVFCLPSSYEGFGRPYIEAMAAGTPVISSPNPGAREVLKNNEYGIIAADTELPQALIRMLKDDSLRQAYIEKGRERAQLFSWDKVALQYEDVYNGLLNKKNKRNKNVPV